MISCYLCEGLPLGLRFYHDRHRETMYVMELIPLRNEWSRFAAVAPHHDAYRIFDRPFVGFKTAIMLSYMNSYST
jgi:hypothetical protein